MNASLGTAVPSEAAPFHPSWFLIIKETVRTRGVGRSENVGPGRRNNVLVLLARGDRNCALDRSCILDTADLVSMDQPHLP